MESMQIGQYILEEKLGEGGMAEVWKARNSVLGNYTAIKFLNAQYAGNPDIEQRFLGEGKRQAHLQHPNIVSAFDFLYVDGRSYLVMRYVKGESLEDRLFRLRAPMPLQAVLSISNDVLGALDYAHSERVIHRDIKPSNILLESSGKAQVVDFGIAVVMGEQRVTRAGVAIGTPHYMSPEQIVGSRDFDHRSDIYSYGCVLYQMLTERPPFDAEDGEGDTEFFVKSQHVNRPPRPLRDFNPEVPEYVERAVLRCLEKKASDRFDSCRDLQTALLNPPTARTAGRMATVMEPAFPVSPEPRRTQIDVSAQSAPSAATTGVQAPPTVVPPTARKSNKVWIVAATIAALLIGGGGFYWFTRPAPVKVAQNQPKIEPTSPPPAVQPPVAVPPTQNAPRVQPPVKRPLPKPAATTEVPRPIVPQTAPVAAPVPSTNPAGQKSGVLRYAGGPVPPGGEVVFENLPKERLKFDWDRNAWKLFLRTGPGGKKDLVLTSIASVPQTSCNVTWTVKE